MKIVTAIWFWHNYLCHSDGTSCEDGCNKSAIPQARKIYEKLTDQEVEKIENLLVYTPEEE